MALEMKRISTHVLDTVVGKPAKDVRVELERRDGSGNWRLLTSARTDRDGRCGQLLADGEALQAGSYRLTFDTASYFAAENVQALYPTVDAGCRFR